MQNTRQRTRAQALVEFALAAMLIFFLLSAAIDLGLIFFRHQGLYNASLEGAQFGSRYTRTFTGAELIAKYPSEVERQRIGCLVINPDPAGQYICIDEEEVRNRLVNEAGNSGGIGLVNMKDLNSNGLPDDADPEFYPEDYIEVRAISAQGRPTEDNPLLCPSIANPPPGSPTCYIYVNVRSDYNMLFLLAPAFGDTVNVSAHTIYPVRTGVFQPGTPVGTVSIATVTASPTSTKTPTPTSTNTASATTSAASPTSAPPGPSSTPTGSSGAPSPTSKPGQPTKTPAPTNTSTNTSPPAGTRTPSNTRTPTRTRTQTMTPSKTLTPSKTVSPSRTFTPSRTSTASQTRTPSQTRTRTMTPSRTLTPLPSNTRTQTATPSKTNTPPPPTSTRTPAPPTRTATTEGT